MADALTPTQRREIILAAIKERPRTSAELVALVGCAANLVRQDASRMSMAHLIHPVKEKGPMARVHGGTHIAIYHFGPSPGQRIIRRERTAGTVPRQVTLTNYRVQPVSANFPLHDLFWHKVAA